jgi:hypothetical protein
MKAMIHAACALAAISMTLNADAAAYLVSGARIVGVVVRNSAGSPTELMEIETTGGSGPCANGDISFQTTGDVNRDSRMVSLATAALLSGKTVKIYDYATTHVCTGADFISIYD